MNTINKLISASILSLAVSHSTFALAEGPYLGAGIGGSILNNFSDASKENDDPQLAGRVFAGYNFNNWLGLELSYSRYGNTEYTQDDSFDTVTYDYKMNAISLVGKAYLPLDSQAKLSAYGLLGVSYLSASADTKFVGEHVSNDSSHVYSPTAGGGFQYAFNEHLQTNLEYSYAKEKNGDSDHLGIPDSNLLTFNIAVKL
jgi:opacity protein-like surface antigen